MYRRNSGNKILLVGVYVDDLVITGSSVSVVEEFKEEMKKAFLMSDLGLPSFYLGIEVTTTLVGVYMDDLVITLRKTHYKRKILEMAGMVDYKAVVTPMEERVILSHDSIVEEVDVMKYRRIVGSLWYLVHTQPNLAYAVGYVSQFLKRPTEEHLQVVKKILCYIARTLGYGLRYWQWMRNAGLVGYCDSDLTGDIDTRKSTTDILFFLSNCLVSWKSLKQRVVALSSCEAEDIAATTAVTQAI
jgi:hypothetical protein